MKFSQVFSDRRVFLPVVHVLDVPSALRNVGIARDNGAHGVFLIYHGPGAHQHLLMEAYNHVRAQHPQWWVGLNFLGASPRAAFHCLPATASGHWLDEGGIDLDAEFPAAGAEHIASARARARDRGWYGLHFGGVAFKHQKPVRDPAEAARLAASYMDVVTTSGERTGSPAPIEKIRSMRKALGEHPLAVASGVAPDNVGEYLPHVDAYLVSTGISVPETDDFDPLRVRALADRIRAF